MPQDFDARIDLEAQRIARAVEALRADYQRQGYITEDQVLRTVHKRKIAAEGHIRLRQVLTDAGIRIENAIPAGDADPGFNSEERGHNDAVRRYLVEIGKYRLLRPEEEVMLSRRVQAGRQALEALSRSDLSEDERNELVRLHRIGREAEQQMISANLRLVISVAKRYSKTFSMDILDLIQEGTLGLIRAVERFDSQRGYKFSTYATWWILQGIARSIADTDRLIRLPVHTIESLRKVQVLRRRLSSSLWGAEPDAQELAIHLGWPLEKVRFLLSLGQDVLSLDAPVRESEESSLGDLLASSLTPDPEQLLAERQERRQISAAVDNLGDATAEVIRLRFGIGASEELTLQEIGEIRGVTRERIRQIEVKGLKLLRRKSRSLRYFWEREPVLANTHQPSLTSEDANLVKATHGPDRPMVSGVLTNLFDRLSTQARRILILRYGLGGEDAISEEATSARLEIDLESLLDVESRALGALGHTRDSFRKLLNRSAAIRESLAAHARAAGVMAVAEGCRRRRRTHAHDYR